MIYFISETNMGVHEKFFRDDWYNSEVKPYNLQILIRGEGYFEKGFKIQTFHKNQNPKSSFLNIFQKFLPIRT